MSIDVLHVVKIEPAACNNTTSSQDKAETSV